ncbi:MAG: aminotransferase class IV [Prolixibacteraceae bacterium]|nr:aminotransferase class IV [Prolixibacteraceae bacterium]
MNFVIFNGEIVNRDEINYGNLITCELYQTEQKVWFGYGGIPLFNENIELLVRQAGCLNIPVPKEIENRKELLRLTKRMLNKSRFYRSGYIIFRILFTGTDSHSLISPVSSPQFHLPFSQEGLLITFSDHRKFSRNEFNKYAFFSKPIWDAALSDVKGTYYSNAVILNENDMVCECAGANIFFIKGNKLIIPPLYSGCYHDTLHEIVIDAAKKSGIIPAGQEEIQKEDINEMDEIFIASEQSGLSRITGVDTRRFVTRHSAVIYDKISEILKAKCS